MKKSAYITKASETLEKLLTVDFLNLFPEYCRGQMPLVIGSVHSQIGEGAKKS